jgi:hypothetical protein
VPAPGVALEALPVPAAALALAALPEVPAALEDALLTAWVSACSKLENRVLPLDTGPVPSPPDLPPLSHRLVGPPPAWRTAHSLPVCPDPEIDVADMLHSRW